MGNQQTIAEAALNKIQELEREVLALRQSLFEVAGTQLPKIRTIEFDEKYVKINCQQKLLSKVVIQQYKKDVKQKIQQIFEISNEYGVEHYCQYFEEYLAN